MATLEKVQTQIAKLQAQADALIKKQSSTVIGKIRDLMDRHGLSVADIDAYTGGKKRGRKPGAKALPKTAASAKYRNPKTGATWTGHGRAPAWIAAAKDRTKFLIDGSAAQPIVAARKAAKGDNYVRGPQAPKYRDPRTGSAWSGRGPAPAWLADAKDRSKFLIAGADEGAATTSKPAPVKKATKKTARPKAAARKVSAKKGRAVTSAPSAKKVVIRKAAVKKPVVKKAVAKKATSSPAPVQGIEATPAVS